MEQKEFKALFWDWIEEQCREQCKQDAICLDTKKHDENQNNLMNLTFGLSDFGRMKYLLELRDVQRDEKALQVAMKRNKDSELVYEL